jgi:hypothetical protein
VGGVHSGSVRSVELPATPTGQITVWMDLEKSTHNIVNSAGRDLRLIAVSTDIIHAGTAAAGGASTITLDAGASAVNSIYNGTVISLLTGTGLGQSRVILSYVGATKVATVDVAWTVVPDNTTTFEITPTISAACADEEAASIKASMLEPRPEIKMATRFFDIELSLVASCFAVQ